MAAIDDRMGGDVERLLSDATAGGTPDLSYRDLLAHNARVRGGHTAIVIGDTGLSYAGLAADAAAASQRLHRDGVQAGDHVGLLGANTRGWVATLLGALSVGAIVIPVNARYSEAEIEWLIDAAQMKGLYVQPRFGHRDLSALLDRVAEHTPELVIGMLQEQFSHPDQQSVTQPEAVPGHEVGVIMYTSGSTSRPKGCMLTQSGMIRNACQHTHRLGITEADGWFSSMPFYHAGGMVWGITSTLVTGATLVTQETFDPGEALELLARESCTYHHGIDTMFIAEIEHPSFSPRRMQSLRIVNSTGTPAMLRRIAQAFPAASVLSKWGLTEGYGNLTLSAPSAPEDVRLTTVGQGYRGIEYRVDAAPGQAIGEILVRGAVMVGYFNDPDATRATVDDDGWLHTGDLGSFDADGYLHYAGRVKQMLKVGGENVSAMEIEDVLLSDSAVRAACVISRPEPRLGEVPVAVVAAAPATRAIERRLHERCRSQLARYKLPTRILVLAPEEFPMTGSGKPDRPRLGQLVEEVGQ